MERRTFLQTVSAAVGTSALAGQSIANPLDSLPTQLRFEPADETVRDGMRYRKLGKTGEMVSCIGVGGYHLGLTRDEDEAIKIVRTALDAGLNFMDNCWDYHDGLSELRMGKALKDGYRKKAFDDEDRRAHQADGGEADRPVLAPVAD